MRAKYNDLYYVPNSRPPRIEFQITVINDKNNRSKYFGFKGELRYEVSGKKASLTEDVFIKLGDLFDPRIQILDLQPEKSNTIFLNWILDPYQKNVIEEKRDGNLYIRIYLRSYQQELPPESELKPIHMEECWVSGPRHGNMIEIPTSKWSEIISEAGYEKYQLIEIPIDYQEIISSTGSIQDIGFGSRLIKATEQLTLILRHMDEGDWAKAVADCRVALEALTRGDVIVKGKRESSKRVITNTLLASGIPEDNVQDFNKLIERLKGYSSTQHHIKLDTGKDVELPAPMGREDALFTVTATTTIINLLSRKYRRQTKLA